MAGVFGKDPNMKRTNQSQLERTNAERTQKRAEAAARFNQRSQHPLLAKKPGK